MKRPLIIIILILLSIIIHQHLSLSDTIGQMRTLRQEIADYTDEIDTMIAEQDKTIAEIKDGHNRRSWRTRAV